MSRINRADWTKGRIAAFRRYLSGDKEAKYHGQKKNGEPYKNPLKVSKLIDYYSGYTFSIGKGAKLMVSGEGHGPREVLTDEQVATRARACVAGALVHAYVAACHIYMHTCTHCCIYI